MSLKSITQIRILLIIVLVVFASYRMAIAESMFTKGEDYKISLSVDRTTKYLAVSGGGIQSGANVILWKAKGQDDIRWLFHHVGHSRYKIQNRKSGRYLAVSGGGIQNGAKVIQWTDDGQRDVIWEVKPDRGRKGVYTLRNKNSGLYLAVSGGQIRDGGNVIQWENIGQTDIFWRVFEASGNIKKLNKTVGRPHDYGYASSPVRSSIPLLLMLTEFSDSTLDRPVSFYDNLIFGPSYPNATHLFQEFSNNKFTFTRAGSVKIKFDFPMTNLPPDFDALSIQRALQLSGINPARFDNNPRDGRVTDRELMVLSINANIRSGEWPGAQTRGVRNFRYADTDMNVRISSSHMYGDINLYAHELFHQINPGAAHIYGPTGRVNLRASFFAGHFQQANTPGPIYLDPYNRSISGWVKPRVFYPTSIKTSTWISLKPNASASFSPIILHRNVDHGKKEFFILEHRDIGKNQYDAGGLGSGLAIWYVQTNNNYTPIDYSWPPPFSGGAVRSGTHIFANFLIGTNGPGRGDFWNSSSEIARLSWGDGTDSGIRVRAKNIVNNKLQVEWWTE